MSLKRSLILILCGCATFIAAVPAQAGNGHLLHGIGAVNSSLGGAGTGLPYAAIGSLHANPALLTKLDDYRVEISAEAFKDDLSATTTAPSLGFAEHTTKSDGELGILPAIGWSYHKPGSKAAFGFGLLAVAGFRTNFPVDPQSALTAPQPFSFGRLATDLAITKIPVAFAWQATPKLSLGASLNVYQGSLVIQPLPVVVPDCNPSPTAPNATCFRPGTSGQVASYTAAPQVGLLYEINPAWSLGFSYTFKQNFPEYEWNSNHANPNLPNFGQARKVSIDIDGPPIASLGLGYRPNPDLKVALDIRWVGYADTEGIGGSGGINSQQQLISIGWDDILIYMLGVEYQATPTIRLRAGLNFNDSPIQDQLTLNSGGTPSVFEQHYTVGASFAVLPRLDLDLGAYYTPENEKTGPIYGANNVVFPGSSITLRNSILSGLAGFSFHF
jgi:long-chain fatty acid transport protein